MDLLNVNFGYKMKSICLLVILYILFHSTNFVRAEDLIANVVSADFVESYDDNSPSSGIPLAGLSIGVSDGLLETENVRIAAPLDNKFKTCIVARTRDGRYYSENIYRVPIATSELKSARLEPITRKYKDDLVKYKSASLAIVGRRIIKSDCGLPATMYLPRIFSLETSKLFMSINSGRGSNYISANLYGTTTSVDMVSRVFVCRTLNDGKNIAFDRECVVDIGGLEEQIVKIELIVDNSIKPKKHEYEVLLPRVVKQ